LRRPQPRQAEQVELPVAQPETLAIELSESHALLVSHGQPSPRLRHALDAARNTLQHELGLRVPQPVVRIGALPPGQYRLIWRELAEPARALDPAAPEADIAAALLSTGRLHADDCLGIEDVQRMLDALEREHPALVRLTVPRLIGLPLLAQVLRGLVREGVSVRWLSEILEAIAPHVEREPRPEPLIERARRALARRITGVVAPEGTLQAIRLGPELEEAIHDAIKRDGSHEWLALPPQLADEMVQAVLRATAQEKPPFALLTQSALRLHVRTLLQDSAPGLPVLCPEELAPGTKVVSKTTVAP